MGCTAAPVVQSNYATMDSGNCAACVRLTVLAALSVCAFSVAAAIFMVVAMDEAFVGVMRISSEPLRNALAVISK